MVVRTFLVISILFSPKFMYAQSSNTDIDVKAGCVIPLGDSIQEDGIVLRLNSFAHGYEMCIGKFDSENSCDICEEGFIHKCVNGYWRPIKNKPCTSEKQYPDKDNPIGPVGGGKLTTQDGGSSLNRGKQPNKNNVSPDYKSIAKKMGKAHGAAQNRVSSGSTVSPSYSGSGFGSETTGNRFECHQIRNQIVEIDRGLSQLDLQWEDHRKYQQLLLQQRQLNQAEYNRRCH